MSNDDNSNNNNVIPIRSGIRIGYPFSTESLGPNPSGLPTQEQMDAMGVPRLEEATALPPGDDETQPDIIASPNDIDAFLEQHLSDAFGLPSRGSELFLVTEEQTASSWYPYPSQLEDPLLLDEPILNANQLPRYASLFPR